MLYRIYTEAVQLSEIEKIFLNRGVNSFSFVRQDGYWKGSPESSLVLEVFDETGDLENQIYAIAEEIRALNDQDVVYVAAVPLRAVKSITS